LSKPNAYYEIVEFGGIDGMGSLRETNRSSLDIRLEGVSSGKLKKSQAEKRKMLSELMSACILNYSGSAGQIWVLRNLTTNEYVRCRPGRTHPVKHGYLDHIDAPDLRIDDLLLMRIGWSKKSPSPAGQEVLDNLIRGPWAGHCFDIIPLETAITTDYS
jgi:hypothetical protein